MIIFLLVNLFIYISLKITSKKFLEFNIENGSLYIGPFNSMIYINKNTLNIINEIESENIYLQKYLEVHNCRFYPEINSFFLQLNISI